MIARTAIGLRGGWLPAAIVALVVAGCITAPPTRPNGPSAAPSGTQLGDAVASPEPAAAAAVLAGLYAPTSASISGSEQAATILSVGSCEQLVRMLDSSDWSVAYDFTFPKLSASSPLQRWLVLSRGTDRALVRMAQSGGCSARVDRAQSVQLSAAGLVTANGDSLAYPLGCIGTEDKVQIRLGYDGPGAFRAVLSLEVPATKGTTKVTPASFGEGGISLGTIAVGRSNDSIVKLTTKLFSTGGAKIGAVQEVAFGSGSTGTITIDSSDPLRGTVDLTGLAASGGKKQSLKAGFACAVKSVAKPLKPQPSNVPSASDLTFTIRLAATTNVLPITKGSATVTLSGKLAQGAETGRYTADVTATGKGSFDELNTDTYSGRCKNSWNGTQAFAIKGTLDGAKLKLTLAPKGKPQVTYAKACNRASHAADETFPNVSALKNGDLTVKWPPASGGQKITNKIQGIGTDTWTVTFAKAG